MDGGIEGWNILSYRSCLALYKSKFRKKPEKKIEMKVLRIPKVPVLTEADYETAEKEVNIIAKEVVSGAPPLAETGAALDAEPKSNL